MKTCEFQDANFGFAIVLPAHMSKICVVVQQPENAWVQHAFKRHEFNDTLGMTAVPVDPNRGNKI